jgi:hypothetical protein
MPLLGSAAMLLSFDVVEEAVADHDHWHTYEHLPERLSIPGFLRGTRWVAIHGQPRYFVLYEVEQLVTLTSEAYLTRLNNPSAWTKKVMPHYRGMSRGLCTVSASFGHGLGNVAKLLRFKPETESAASLRSWLVDEALPGLPQNTGLGCAHLLEGAAAAPMTNEQRIRGADAGVDWALIVTGYEREALDHAGLGSAALAARGATGVQEATYRLHYTLSHGEVDA